jgi:hypothetical protein
MLPAKIKVDDGKVEDGKLNIVHISVQSAGSSLGEFTT